MCESRKSPELNARLLGNKPPGLLFPWARARAGCEGSEATGNPPVKSGKYESPQGGTAICFRPTAPPPHPGRNLLMPLPVGFTSLHHRLPSDTPSAFGGATVLLFGSWPLLLNLRRARFAQSLGCLTVNSRQVRPEHPLGIAIVRIGSSFRADNVMLRLSLAS